MDPKTLESLKEGLIAAGIVAAVAAAFALPLAVLFRLGWKPFRTPWPHPGIPWRTAGILLAMFPIGLIGFQLSVAAFASVVSFDPPELALSPEAANQLRQLRPMVLATPLFLIVYIAARTVLKLPPPRDALRNILLGILAWAILMPLTFAVHFVVLQVFLALGIPEVQHPLTALKPQDDGFHGVLFALSVCLCTPLVEEILFRGLLVPWASQKRIYPGTLMVAALSMAALTGEARLGPVAFVLLLGATMLAVVLWAPRPRVPRRTVAAILSSAALFAAAHSAVWPTPIPLFVLACGLGYLTARTRSIVSAIVVHGLFNAVSFVMLCRGSAL